MQGTTNKASLNAEELVKTAFEIEKVIVSAEIDSLSTKMTEELDKDIQADIKALSLKRDQHRDNFTKIIGKINSQREQTKKTRGEMIKALRSWRKSDEDLRGASKRIMKIEALINVYEKDIHEKKSLIDSTEAADFKNKRSTAEQKLSSDLDLNKALKDLNEIEEKIERTTEARDHLINRNNKILTEIFQLEEANIKQETESQEHNRILTESFDLLKNLNRNSDGSIYKGLPKLPSEVQDYQELVQSEIERMQKTISKIDPSLSIEKANDDEDKSIEIMNQIEKLRAEKFDNDMELFEVDNDTNTLVTQREEAEKEYKKRFGKMVDLVVEIYELSGKLTFLSLKNTDEKIKELNLLYHEKDESSKLRNNAFDQTMVHHHIVVKNLDVKKQEEVAIADLCYKLEKELENLTQAQKDLSLAQEKVETSQLIKDSISRAMILLKMKEDALNKILKSIS